ncbi:hypothetical protein EMIHUDRAFT_123616, partial [Emiliania huxleyi CCMP1516]|uniref:Poly [ADP-ribose] polymerase n=2 Tax=Emiliania huxleyi TaxID=2903 RepID=A0A0D3JLK3_EMIH1
MTFPTNGALAGGFYGQGIYLAEDPSYPIGGRYAHRVSGSGGSRVQLLIVKAALGSQQEMGQQISAETRAMRMRTVRGGPHRPFLSGGGENGCDASIVHVVYESRQMYPAYVIEVEMEMGAEVVAAVRKNSAEGSASAGPAPKRQRHAAPSGGGGGGGGGGSSGGGSSGGGSSHSAAYVPAAAPPSVAEVRAMGVAAAVAALRAHASVSRVALVACGRLAELCLEAQNRQPAADTGAIEAIVAALQAHPQVVGVQQNGCGAMANAHPEVAGVQEECCRVVGSVCFGTDAAGIARKQRAAGAGAMEL